LRLRPTFHLDLAELGANGVVQVREATLDLLRPELWEHLIAALFYRRHDRITRRVACVSCFELYRNAAIKASSGGLYYASVKFGQSRELVHHHMIVEGLHDR
jgi:hypothetical protein